MKAASRTTLVFFLLFISTCLWQQLGHSDSRGLFSMFVDQQDIETPADIRFLQEPIIDQLGGPHGAIKAKDLRSRRYQQGFYFSMPELKHVVHNMRRQLQAIKQMDACKDKNAVDGMIAALGKDVRLDYPYKQTLLDLFKANLIVDLVYSRKFTLAVYGNTLECAQENSIRNHLGVGVLQKDKTIVPMWAYAYPGSYTENTILTLDLTSRPTSEQALSVFGCLRNGPSEPSSAEALLQLIDRDDIVLLPTFETLSQDYFVETSPHRVYPLGLTRSYAVNDEGEYSGTGHFFAHDLEHTIGILKHNIPFKGCTEAFPKTCDEHGLCHKDSSKLSNQVIEALYRTVKQAEWLPQDHKEALMPILSRLFFDLTHEQREQGCSPMALAFLTSQHCENTITQINKETRPKTPFERNPIFTDRAIAWIVRVGEYLRERGLWHARQRDLCLIYEEIDAQIPSYWRSLGAQDRSGIICPD